MKHFLIPVLLCSAAFAQVAEKANERYQTKEGRDEVARELENPNRDKTDRPRDLVEAMGLKERMKVADVGTGVGYMLPYLSHAVGPDGVVYGEDIAQDFLDRAQIRINALGLKNVKLVLGTEEDAKLPGGILNAVLILDSYHHFNYPVAMLKGIHDSLESDGKLFIVDYYKRPNAMGPGSGDRAVQHIRLDLDDMIKEVEESGFHLLWKRDQIAGRQYIAAFEKAKEEP